MFTSVSGTWTQPALNCSGGSLASAYWVGLDGDTFDVPTSTTVEQIGTEADCIGRNTSDYAWYSLYPGGPNANLSPSAYPVAAGDTISASVVESKGPGGAQEFTLTISDDGTGNGTSWNYESPTISPSSPVQLASAEWIAEAPSFCTPARCRTLSLADFGAVTFSNASATAVSTTTTTIDSISSSSWRHDPITMVTPSATASPGPLLSSGYSFTVTYASVSGHGHSHH